MLSGQKIVLAVTGSIAAYKSCELLRLLIKRGAEVSVIMTEAAQRFVTPLSFQALGAKKVYTGDWDDSTTAIPHIEATKEASLLLVAPATANILAKAAQGLADDLLSAAILAARCPVAYAPAMNTFMWHNQATQRNVTQLTQDGAIFLGPDSGEQACGDIGSGRMLEPEDIIELLQGAFSPRLLDRCRVLITAGPTYEPIDPVRGITNLSSGKQGFAIAKAAALAGAEVTLIAGKCDLKTPAGVKRIDVTTAREMYDAVMQEVAQHEIFISVAAVADWRVANASDHKIKKEFAGAPDLQFEENPDILASVAALENAPYCVGFAAETDNLIDNARAKLYRKNVPLIVANLVSDAMNQDTNAVVFVERDAATPLAKATKEHIAQALIAKIAQEVN
ncbi:bifunctional phosphopantothenoylcysteine decarboxylase/phosphopantothenate--cysteine ligase CoaBC [Parasutterella secunda]|uniref:bifunctional phosphopantothenoylcysteine decarboxylase/phosphopantothenate--cysteine ligase CoaBC n=1 Tax=Parasutterella secunda TaxID=626947 RepID=UPI001F8AF3B1|nr:bifunctional phosphopantothenoylcysteine decarboxylase/phosphopantothenate--cysteine ligase CoaBC [Parasutterella secunda]MDM8113390.1 bifunctional phosphopantothenoylcysteine decarboxylase/phosphopantothenate--cysteine ligase CoaBC [Parasutterella secunda]MDM8218569.1 bifunctional phosphopantothenoylcysteine decarboxylase/phosphopantothenate--cysteine ligase CoaBC [Parasutterella secunda]HIR21122.1 bifunctional phosphopantothenoylcysteine decarboxylase/phosphopantothenate--cysteine ligase Co